MNTFSTNWMNLWENDLDWERCCGICSDGAKSMMGRHSGLISRVKEVAPRAMWTHCTIHRQTFPAKKMPNDLQSVLERSCENCQHDKNTTSKCSSFPHFMRWIGSALQTAASAHRGPSAGCLGAEFYHDFLIWMRKYYFFCQMFNPLWHSTWVGL